jgi:hypothetical protein
MNGISEIPENKVILGYFRRPVKPFVSHTFNENKWDFVAFFADASSTFFARHTFRILIVLDNGISHKIKHATCPKNECTGAVRYGIYHVIRVCIHIAGGKKSYTRKEERRWKR